MIKFEITPHTLHFRQPAGTSRGVYTKHNVWYIHVTDGISDGYGECAPLEKLSCDDMPAPAYEKKLKEMCDKCATTGKIPYDDLINYPSMLFGIECAMKQYHNGSHCLWNTSFSRGESGIPINGLIWMGTKEQMLEQIKIKMESGFRCIKIKIGAIDFNDELDLIKHIRQTYSSKEIELRVDANGGFTFEDAPRKIEQLSRLDLHSIEQPIPAGEWFHMAKLCANTPLPIALDEELIGNNTPARRHALISTIHPQYIVIKPTLHGGIAGTREWIHTATAHKIGWWITSALESNIGLNCIAQLCATLNPTIPQGLGTGQLFTDNISSPLEIRKDCLWYGEKKWGNIE
jgi:o-succinylbenzoate synthase